jgi:hypothetical protein
LRVGKRKKEMRERRKKPENQGMENEAKGEG